MTHLDSANELYHEAQDQMSLLPNYYRWMFSSFRPYLRGRVLDLGAGAGHLIPSYAEVASEIVALDNNPMLVAKIKERYEPLGVDAILADLREDFSAAFNRKFDTIVALDVLEHFERDDKLVAQAAKLLTESGRLIVKVPADSRLYGEVDRASGHFRRYDTDDLDRLMARFKLRPLALSQFNRPGRWMYARRKDRKSNFSRTFSRSTMRLINVSIPFLSLVDRLLPGKGLSLVGVYERV